MKSKVTYVVEYADWFPIDSGTRAGRPNRNKIDDRTIHNRPFSSLDDAESFAAEVLARRGGKWLAYLRIKKIKTKLLQKLR